MTIDPDFTTTPTVYRDSPYGPVTSIVYPAKPDRIQLMTERQFAALQQARRATLQAQRDVDRRELYRMIASSPEASVPMPMAKRNRVAPKPMAASAARIQTRKTTLPTAAPKTTSTPMSKSKPKPQTKPLVGGKAPRPSTPPAVDSVAGLRRTEQALLTAIRASGNSAATRTELVGALTDVRTALVARGEPLPPIAAAPRDERLAKMDRAVARALGKDKTRTVNVGGFQVVGAPADWRPY